jgi:uncharacterized protein
MAHHPVPDIESAPFWEGLGHHEIVVRRCLDCGRDFFPRMPACPWYGHRNLTDQVVSGKGHIYSWVRVHRALSDDPAVEPPYVVASIDLDDGCRMFGRLEPQEAAAIGLAVSPRFVEHDGWTELVFEPSPS